MSAQKTRRIEQFNRLKELQEAGFYNHLEWSTGVLVAPDSLTKNTQPNAILHQQKIEFLCENVVKTIENSTHAAVLVFASAKNPGGGVENGAKAQEEDISLQSSWYFQARKVAGFYLERGSHAVNSDNMIYVENGYLLRNEYGEDIDPLKISFIGACAPNLNGMQQQKKTISEKQLEAILDARIENIFKLAQKHKKQELILGAWGCGVFGLEPKVVASIFKKKMSEGWFNGDIKFSIMDYQMLETFQHIIAPQKPKLRV